MNVIYQNWHNYCKQHYILLMNKNRKPDAVKSSFFEFNSISKRHIINSIISEGIISGGVNDRDRCLSIFLKWMLKRAFAWMF